MKKHSSKNSIIDSEGHSGHRIIEGLSVLRRLREVFPNRYSEDVIECDLAGLDTMHQIAPGWVMFLSQFDSGESTQRAGGIGLQSGSQRR